MNYNKTVKKQPEPDFDYSFNKLSGAELTLNHNAILERIENLKMVCLNPHCKTSIKFYFKDKGITAKCNCGTYLIYPKREDRGGAYGFRFVSKSEVLKYGRKTKYND